VNVWCEKGLTRRQLRFDLPEGTTLVEVAANALALASGPAREHWVSQFTSVDLDLCNDLVVGIPDLSEPTRTFINEVLTINMMRIRDAF
jgi:hypothetical protein